MIDFGKIDLGGVEGVVFDFGGVISYQPGERAPIFAAGEKWGITRERYREAFVKYRQLWDGGEIDGVEMYRRIIRDIDPAATPSRADLDALWRADAMGWIGALRPQTLPYMRQVKESGRKIGILTNLSADFFAEYFKPRCAEHIALADAVVVSAHEHLLKPYPEIYSVMASRLGLPPEKLLFLDDTPANVEGAIACGWRAILVQ